MSDPQPVPPLIERLEEARRIATQFPEGLVADLLATLDQERALRQAAEQERDTFDAQAVENWALYQAAETALEKKALRLSDALIEMERAKAALAEERKQRTQVEADWIDGQVTLNHLTRRIEELKQTLAEERQARERVENDYRLTCESWTEDYQQMSYTVSLIIAERDQDRAALAACEARLASLTNRGAHNPNAKLTDESVRAIRAKLQQGVSKAQLARDYGVSRATILAIATGKEWQHVTRAHPAPPSVEDVRDPMRLLYRLTLDGARRDWSAEHDSRCRLGDWDCVGDAPACPYPLAGWSVWKAWRDGMLAQSREVAPERMDWGTVSAHDKALDAEIEAGILLAVAHPAHGLGEAQRPSGPPSVGAPPPVEEMSQ